MSLGLRRRFSSIARACGPSTRAGGGVLPRTACGASGAHSSSAGRKSARSDARCSSWACRRRSRVDSAPAWKSQSCMREASAARVRAASAAEKRSDVTIPLRMRALKAAEGGEPSRASATNIIATLRGVKRSGLGCRCGASESAARLLAKSSALLAPPCYSRARQPTGKRGHAVQARNCLGKAPAWAMHFRFEGRLGGFLHQRCRRRVRKSRPVSLAPFLPWRLPRYRSRYRSQHRAARTARRPAP